MSNLSIYQSWDGSRNKVKLELSFSWSYSAGDSMHYECRLYHGDGLLEWDSFSGVNNGGGYGITKILYIDPFIRLKFVYGANCESNSIIEDFCTMKHPYLNVDSYIKPSRPPVHTQWAYYVDAREVRETGSCVANSICLGIDTVHLNLYGSTCRPSVGYLYGAMYQDKDESYGMYTNEVLEYVKSNGIGISNLIKGDALQYSTVGYGVNQYGNIYLKQPAYLQKQDGSYKTYNGAVQVHNNNKNDSDVSNSTNYAKIDHWYEKGRTSGIYETMEAVMDNKKIAVLDYGVNNVFDSTGSDGIVKRMYSNSRIRMNHCSTIVGWKKVGIEYYWILQNSWGSGVADNGLYYMPVSWFGDIGATILMGGIWGSYTFTYSDNGAYQLPKMNPPTLRSDVGKDGRGRYGSLYVKWDKQSDAAGGYEISFIDESGNETIKKTSYDFQNASDFMSNKYGEAIKMKVRKNAGGTFSAWSNQNIATTLPKEPSISAGVVSPSTATVNASVASGKYTDVVVHRYLNNVYQESKVSYGGYAVFEKLPQGTYTFNAETRLNVNGTTLVSYDKSNTITIKVLSVDAFYWNTNFNSDISYSNGSDNNIYVYPVTFSEWNSYIATLKKVREAKKITTPRPLTEVSRGGNVKDRVNEAINALNDLLIGGDRMTNISSTTVVTASVFLDLQDKLNKVISTL